MHPQTASDLVVLHAHLRANERLVRRVTVGLPLTDGMREVLLMSDGLPSSDTLRAWQLLDRSGIWGPDPGIHHVWMSIPRVGEGQIRRLRILASTTHAHWVEAEVGDDGVAIVVRRVHRDEVNPTTGEVSDG